MRTRFLPAGEKKKLISDLEEQFGISKIPGMLIEAGREKIRLFTGSLTREQIMDLSRILRVELIGLYAFKLENIYRISFDSIFLFEEQMSKNIIEINDLEVREWMRGHDLQKACVQGVVVVKYKSYFLGCGKSNGNVIFNYVPKNRRFVK